MTDEPTPDQRDVLLRKLPPMVADFLMSVTPQEVAEYLLTGTESNSLAAWSARFEATNETPK
jgi:hypothetical protein